MQFDEKSYDNTTGDDVGGGGVRWSTSSIQEEEEEPATVMAADAAEREVLQRLHKSPGIPQERDQFLLRYLLCHSLSLLPASPPLSLPPPLAGYTHLLLLLLHPLPS